MKKLFRLLRYDWPLHVVFLMMNWLPDNVACLRIRGRMARFFIGECGADLRIGRNVTLYNPARIELGTHVYLAYGCWIMADAPIRVADEVMFGPYCVVASSDHTRIDGSFRFADPEASPIQIGKGAWLGAHVVVTAGSSVGAGSLVAAHSVVVGDVADDMMVGGQPATAIRPL